MGFTQPQEKEETQKSQYPKNMTNRGFWSKFSQLVFLFKMARNMWFFSFLVAEILQNSWKIDRFPLGSGIFVA